MGREEGGKEKTAGGTVISETALIPDTEKDVSDKPGLEFKSPNSWR